jgi:hypothetical protein
MIQPQQSALLTSTLMHARTGNVLLDTVLALLVGSLVSYASLLSSRAINQLRRALVRLFGRGESGVCYQGRIYAHRYSETLSEAFVALADWVTTGLDHDEFDGVVGLAEIQLPRHLSTCILSPAPADDVDSPSEDKATAFNRSLLILDQPTPIEHRALDLRVEHSKSSRDRDLQQELGGGGGGGISDSFNDYTDHTFKLTSVRMTPGEIAHFVTTKVVPEFRAKRERLERSQNAGRYYLYDRFDEDTQTTHYDMYPNRSTKAWRHVISEHTATIRERVEHFMTQESWYREQGRPYALTFMLWGPPGCGKTSLVKAVANATGRHLKEVPLPRVKSRRELMEIFHGTRIQHRHVRPRDCVYVFEEFDKMGKVVCADASGNSDGNAGDNDTTAGPTTTDRGSERRVAGLLESLLDRSSAAEDRDASKTAAGPCRRPPTASALSLGDVLSVMDGLLENHGTITFLTANRIDHLHKALLRPGRIDLVLRLGLASTRAVKAILRAAYGHAAACEATIDAIDDDDPAYHERWSPAEVEAQCFAGATAASALAALRQRRSAAD